MIDAYYLVNGIKYYRAIPKKIDDENLFLTDNTITYHFKLKEQSFLVFASVNRNNKNVL